MRAVGMTKKKPAEKDEKSKSLVAEINKLKEENESLIAEINKLKEEKPKDK